MTDNEIGPIPNIDDRPPYVPPTYVLTTAGLTVLLNGGTWDDALAADQAMEARWAAEAAAAEQERRDLAERRRLDLAERRLRLERALDRRRRRQGG